MTETCQHRVTMLLQYFDECPLGRIIAKGTIKNGPGVPQMRVLGDYYTVLYLLKGEGFYRDEQGISRDVRAGDLILLYPDIAHYYGPPSPGQPWDEFYLRFDGPVFDLWRKEKVLDPAMPIWHLEPIDYWLRRFQETIPPAGAPEPRQAVSFICRLQQVLADARRDALRDTVTRADDAWLARVYALLEANLEQPLSGASVAEQAGMSYENFRKRFARLTGTSPGKYRQSRVIMRAGELLHDGQMTCREIALSLGFCDEHHFSRRFKQVVGKSPTQFHSHWGRQ